MHTTPWLSAALGVLLLLATGCRKEPESVNRPAPVPVVLKIAVFSDGRLMAEGEPTNLDALRAALDRLNAQGGVVWYYREGSDQEPPPIALEVMKAVVEAVFRFDFQAVRIIRMPSAVTACRQNSDFWGRPCRQSLPPGKIHRLRECFR
jgi:hypothetical protein